MNKMEEDFVRVIRPIKPVMFSLDHYIKDLNIVGIFKIHSPLVKKIYSKQQDYPTKLDCSTTFDCSKNLECSKKLECSTTFDCPTKNRNDGFNILSDRNNVSSHLRKTKFCKIKITTGYCTRAVCNFAHNMSEYHFAECAFKNNCKKEGCVFKHPQETIEEYKERINFKIPLNIK